MKKLFGFLLLSSLAFTGCKRENVLVQPAKIEVFERTKREKTLDQAVGQNTSLAEIEDETSPVSVNQVAKLDLPLSTLTAKPPQEKKPLLGGGKKKRKKQVQSRQNSTFLERLFPNKQLKQTQKEPTKKKKPLKRWGTMIPTGVVFLGIAILLSLININGLALLFGVAAIFFLYLGIRKLLRKRRRREIFR